MASTPQRMAPTSPTRLPEEIILHIISYLDPVHIAKFQLVSRAFRTICRDNSFWRSRCLHESSFLEAFGRPFLSASAEDRIVHDPFRRITFGLEATSHGETRATTENRTFRSMQERERVRILANWDLSYPSEGVSWYDEYIQRHAPIATSWLQQPKIRDGFVTDNIEARGVSLYRPGHAGQDSGNDGRPLLAVSPLDHGGVCIWDVEGTKGRRGAILAESRPGILFIDGPEADNSRRSKRVDSGVTECVSVDDRSHRAFFAVQSHLIEVDLQRLAVVGCESFPWSITALSAATASLPLTVGTNLGIHLHDYRARANFRNDPLDQIDEFDRLGAKDFYERSLRSLFDDDPLPPYASLSQPGPLNILHLPRAGAEEDISDDIYVAGRFSNILHYDRRKFPSIRGSIHSGARLCSMAYLPHPFSPLDGELRRRGQLSLEQIERTKTVTGGRMLIACGEYNTKGSLEMYGLAPPATASPNLPGGLQDSTFRNRQTSSQSKLLSVANHGTRIAFSDGSGYVKWFERDGFTEVRHHKIGHSEKDRLPSLFSSMPGSDDIARKLIPTKAKAGISDRVNDNDLLFWTGEKLGLVSFTTRPGFAAEDFEESETKTVEEAEREREEREYGEKMRMALERQADDVRFVRNLGLGSGRRR